MKLRLLLFHFLLFSFLLGTPSCKKDKTTLSEDLIENPDDGQDDRDGKEDEKKVTLDNDSLHVEIGDTLVLRPTFGNGENPQKLYSWEIGNKEILELVFVEKDYSVKLLAKKTGITPVTLKSDDGELEAKTIVSIGIEDDGIIRILAIGNSFSEDVLEHYLHDLAAAAGVEVIIGNLYIGGSSLSGHWSNASGNKKAYDFRRIDEDGNKTNTPNSSIAEVVSSENWNYISLQQVSQESGLYNTYVNPFPLLYDYVKRYALNSEVKMVLHQVWAYQETSSHSGFANYGNDQMTMYNAIVDAVWRVNRLKDIDIIVPSGTAIQNGRSTLLGDHFNRDGYHLNALGQYTTSCTWLEAILGISPINNSFQPSGLTSEQVEIAQHVAHAAIENPKEITELEEYLPPPPSGIQDAPVFVGFGSDNITSYSGWNAFSGPDNARAGAILQNLIDYNSDNTGVSIEIIESFNARNDNGIRGISVFGVNVPDDVAGHSYYGNSTGVFGDGLYEQSVLKISGLDEEEYYDFCFYGSREAGGVRESKYTVTGKNSKTTSTDVVAGSVEDRSGCVKGIQPNEDGEITITVTKGDNNDTGQGFYYLNLMRISKSIGPTEGIQDGPVLIGFGSENISNYPQWNAFTGPDHAKSGNRLENLVDYNSTHTGVSIEIVKSFNGRNDNGIRGINVFGISIPDDIAGHSYFGNSTGVFGDGIYEEAELKLTGLDEEELYDFCLYGSREAGGVRETKYVVTGRDTRVGFVDVVDENTDNRAVCIEAVQPNGQGEVTLTITKGDSNDTGQGFYYLNFMKISRRN